MPRFRIGDQMVGDDARVFIVAEIGANHDGDPGLAKELIHMAAEAGADAIKLQTYTAAELVAQPDLPVTWGPEGHRVTEPVGEMFDRVALPREAHEELFELARSLGLVPFSTPFSVDGVEFLHGLGAAAMKIASSDVACPDLLRAAAHTGLPVILSTGKSTLGEIDQAVDLLRSEGVEDLALLHCVAKYPAPVEEMNLRTIQGLATLYPDAVIGLSDHSVGITVSLAAIPLGAKIIERHVTLDHHREGPDHWFSLDPDELASLVREARTVEAALGSARPGVRPCEVVERESAIRSLVLARDVPAGHGLTREDLTALRPGWGISPLDLDKVLGFPVPTALAAGTVLTWDLLKGRGRGVK